MPTYVYECGKCGDELEVWQSFSDDPLQEAPQLLRRQAREGVPGRIVLKARASTSPTAETARVVDGGRVGVLVRLRFQRQGTSSKESNTKESQTGLADRKSDTKDTKKPEPKKADKATASSTSKSS